VIDANDKSKIEYGRDFDARITDEKSDPQRAATPGPRKTKEHPV
jgi:hypothetical protein